MLTIEYSSEYEDILFAVEYLTLPINYKQIPTGIVMHYNNQLITGLPSILNQLVEIIRSEPQDLSIINKEVISQMIEIHECKDDLFAKYNLSDTNPFLNASTFTLSDCVFFYKIYRNSNLKLSDQQKKIIGTIREKINKVVNLDFELLDIRVGKIIQIWDHPNADTLYVEKVDFGDKVIQVVSGVKRFMKKEDMLNKTFLFILNMKKAKLRGEVSEGMILCAKNENKILSIRAPENVKHGERLYLGAKKIFIEPKKYDKSNSDFIETMSQLCVMNYKMMFGNRKIMVDCVEIDVDLDNGTIS